MRVILAGASGLIGTALLESLRSERHEVISLVRREPSGTDERRWDPQRGQLGRDVLDGADAAVCLSGAGLGDHRWSDPYKQTIRRSRTDSVGTLARALAEHGGVHVLLAASAVGYYGDTGDRTVDESAPRGQGFLAELCEQWEAAADPARSAGVRVTNLRTGMVLSGDGGLLRQLRPIVLAGIAGRLGSGRQFMPWISLADEVAAIRFLLEHDITGAVNLASPAPARNAEFMATLGRVLHRPTVLPTPAFALRVVLGEFGSEALSGQRAIPARLAEAGFEFTHRELEPALRWALRS